MATDTLQFVPTLPVDDSYSEYSRALLSRVCSGFGILKKLLDAEQCNYASTGATRQIEEVQKRFSVYADRVLDTILMDVDFKTASKFYLRHHARLPGSMRTSRLRKKRRTKVMRWFRKKYSPVQFQWMLFK